MPPNKKPFRKKIHTLTLLEITVAFFLLSLLLSSLWSVYKGWLFTYQNGQKSQKELQKQIFLHQRLDKIAYLLSSPPPVEEEKNTLFTPKEDIEGFPSVAFSYYAEADPDPEFNGRMRSLISLTDRKTVCLFTWNSKKQVRKETLFAPATALSFSYFDPQTSKWRDDWPESFSHLPIWMKIFIDGPERMEIQEKIDRSLDPILYLEEFAPKGFP